MTIGFQHPSLAAGRWFDFSLAEQLGNIGSEVSRAIKARGDQKKFDAAVSRALELFYLTISDPRWRKRLKELTRARELLCEAVFGNNEYGTLEDLDRYFSQFACAARSPYVQAEEILKNLYKFIDETFIIYTITIDSFKISRHNLEHYEHQFEQTLKEEGYPESKIPERIAQQPHILSNGEFKVQTNTYDLKNILIAQNLEDLQAKNAIKAIYDDWDFFYQKKLNQLLGITIEADIWKDLEYIRQSITHRRSLGTHHLKYAKLIKDFGPGEKIILTPHVMEKIREELEKWYTDFIIKYFSKKRFLLSPTNNF